MKDFEEKACLCALAKIFGFEPKTALALIAHCGCAGSILNILDIPQFNHQVEMTKGVLEEECSRMLKEFFVELRARNKMEKEAAKLAQQEM